MKIPLSNVTLGTVMANVRSQTNTLNEVDSGLYSKQLIDIIHRAVLLVWGKEKPLLRPFYATVRNADISLLPSGKFVIYLSNVEVSDFNSIMLSHDSGEIDIVPRNVYNHIRAVYTDAELATAIFGIVDAVEMYGTGVYGIEIITGSNPRPTTNMKLSYSRVPQLATSETTTIDIPDEYIPIVEATACRLVLEKLHGVMPTQDVKIVEDMNAQMGGKR